MSKKHELHKKSNTHVLFEFVFSSNQMLKKKFHGEFDPGSGRTLAVCLTHASRTSSIFFRKDRLQWRTGEERVRTYLLVGDNSGKLLLKPHNAEERKAKTAKREACV